MGIKVEDVQRPTRSVEALEQAVSIAKLRLADYERIAEAQKTKLRLLREQLAIAEEFRRRSPK